MYVELFYNIAFLSYNFYNYYIIKGGKKLEDLLEKAIKGNEEAFTNLILSYQQDLYKIALTRLHTEDDIQEAIQETMISAYKNIKMIREKDKFKKWLIKILINKCNDIYKKKQLRLIPIEEIDTYKVIDNNNFEIESKLNFYSILSVLNERERLIMVLYYSEKYTIKEIGEILNKKENTIKTILHRAKIKLKDKYKII